MAYSKAAHFSKKQIELADIAKALSHPARIAILEHIAKVDGCICNDIVDELPLSQSTVSQHLKALKQAGLIKGNIEGPSICYCLEEENCSKAKEAFGSLFKKLKCC